jgi:hypothetical protein
VISSGSSISTRCNVRRSLPVDVIARSQNWKATRVDTTNEVRRSWPKAHRFRSTCVFCRSAGGRFRLLCSVLGCPRRYSIRSAQSYPAIAARDEIFQCIARIVSIAVGNTAGTVLVAIRASRRVVREIPPVIIHPSRGAGIALRVSTRLAFVHDRAAVAENHAVPDQKYAALA